MLALGLLFMIVAAAVTAGAIYDGGEDATFEVFGQTVGTTIAGVFILGLGTMLVFFVGVWMFMKALARSRRRRLERKATNARQKQSVAEIEEERARLRAENEELQERLARDTRPAAAPVATSTDDATSTDGGVADRPAPERPSDGDRIVDHRTDLTSREEPATSTSAAPGHRREDV
jgi:ABC-type nickel/cobalt efflux system permease component RcnA